MIYLDTSVALAFLFSEDRNLPETIWEHSLVSSRLIEYEIWTSLHRQRLSEVLSESTNALLGRIALLELSTAVLSRALEEFPKPVRTLDALHLASCTYLLDHGRRVSLASYDHKMCAVATELKIPLIEL